MKLSNTIYAASLAMLCLPSFIACDDRLDVPQYGVESTELYYKTDDECEKAAVYMYSVLKNNFSTLILTKGNLADETYAGGRGMSSDDLNEYVFTSDNSDITGLFQALYSQIYSANLIINHVNPDSQSKKRNLAEALFFRAFSNFDLVTLWGSAPLVLEAQREDYRSSNTPIEETWAQIEKDLTDALALNALPEKNGPNDRETPIRVSKQTVQTLLGKVYLFQKKYAEAAAQLNAVVESGKYKLLDLGKYGYMEYFRALNNNHSEVLLEVNRLNDPATFGFDMNLMFFGFPINRLDGVMNPKNVFFSETWGFNSMVLETLLKDFQDNAAKNGVVDIRYTTTCLSMDYLAEEFGLTMKPGNFFEGACGYGFGRWICWDENHIPMTWAGFQMNSTLMRYAETLLLGAEANLEAGNSAKALDYINQIRVHAGEPTLSSVTLADIKMEKRLELCGEGQRFQDLIRWGDAYEKLKDQGKQIGYFGYGSPEAPNELRTWYPIQQPNAGFKQGKNELLPFPYREIVNNPNIIQNQGY